MTFLELQDMVLERFNTEHREMAKSWINLAYAQLWTAEPWTFRWAEVATSTGPGNVELGDVPADLGRVKGLWDGDGVALAAMQPREFNSRFLAAAAETGAPWAFTVVGGTVKLGPTPAEAATYTLLHLRKITPLVGDAAEPDLPEEYHWLLVPGAQSHGQVVFQDPNAGMSLQAWAAGLDLLRRDYLEAADVAEQWSRSDVY